MLHLTDTRSDTNSQTAVEIPVSEYREELRGSKGRGGKGDRFLLCHREEDTTRRKGGMILPQNTGKGKEVSAEHLSSRFGLPSILKQ